MKPTDFSKYLTDYLTIYLPKHRGMSSNTICSYRDTFILYLRFMEAKMIKADKISISDITKESIVNFLDWLEMEKMNSISTRNLRLACIHSFFKYIQYKTPDYNYEYQQIVAIKYKSSKSAVMSYLTIDGITLLLKQPDSTTIKGLRDLALLSLMYDIGARVSEVTDLTVSSVRFDKPAVIYINGNGNKIRAVPMLDNLKLLLSKYMEQNNLLSSSKANYPLFPNIWGEKLTRAGVSNILKKYLDKARCSSEGITIPNKLSCHSLRHSRAMHLLQAGVDLIYIRDILGHRNVRTTEIYARVDSKMKRDAIENAYIKTAPQVEAAWTNNQKLMDFLKSF